MGKKGSTPPAPDYAALAKEQGVQNLAAAQQTAALNRPDQYDQNGSQTWALKPGADPKNPQPGDWIVTSKLNDTQQALYDQQNALSSQYGTLAQDALGTIGDTMKTKFDTSGLPQASALSNTGLTSLSNGASIAGHQLVNADGLSAYGQVGQSTDATRQAVQDAMYRRQTAMLDPEQSQAKSDLEARLANQGITAGSDAYNREVNNLARQQDAARQQARDTAIGAGGSEESRINQMNLGNAQFSNDTRQQQVNERLGIAGFNNSANDTTFAQQMQNAAMQNSNRGQEFGERQAMNTANNTLHNNAVQEALMQRELPMNEANALRTGNQVGSMNFQQYGGAGQVQAAPTYQAGVDQYNSAIAAQNASNSGLSGLMGGITNLGKVGLSAYSLFK